MASMSMTSHVLSILETLIPPIYVGTSLPAFLALLLSTCSNYMLSPIRDATALTIGVQHIPSLTLLSTILALCSSVPISWLFEAPDPKRRKLFKRVGLTRGETQGSSLALFYRFFAIFLLCYAIGNFCLEERRHLKLFAVGHRILRFLREKTGNLGNVVFFLVVHMMRLHGTSLMWAVASEAMEYEEQSETRRQNSNTATTANNNDNDNNGNKGGKPATIQRGRIRLNRLAFVGFGGTLGGILGSIITSLATHILHLSGLLLLAALFLHLSANLSLELGNIMHRYWTEEQQLNLLACTTSSSSQSHPNDASSEPDISIKRVSSSSSMKRIASGNSLSNNSTIIRSKSETCINTIPKTSDPSPTSSQPSPDPADNNTNIDIDSFQQRLLRAITIILRSKLLMSIFTYNALYASTTVLLSFQRAKLVANRSSSSHRPQTTESQTAFLAKINMTSSVAVFVLQISGIGAVVAHKAGMQGTLSLMPLIRLLGIVLLLFHHFILQRQPSTTTTTTTQTSSNLILFLILDECCKVINFAIAKPVRESLWRGLSSEARYEAKPIVDTLANRWGGGSAAVLVQIVDWMFSSRKEVFGGFPIVVLLCLGITIWWILVSVHLGVVRKRIDVELKKMQ